MTSQLKIKHAYKNGIKNTHQHWYSENENHRI